LSRSFTLTKLIDDKGKTVINAWCRAFRSDTQVLVETQYTDSSGDADFVALTDNVDCYIIAIWGNNVKWFFSEGTIGTTEIDTNAITTTKIFDAAVSEAKIATDAITTDKVKAANITTAKIANLAVTTALINNLAVTTAKIGDLQVTNAKINDLNVNKLVTGTMTADVTISNTFKTAASPNPRIEITSALFVGYSDATTKQFYVQTSDGKAYFGGGTCWLDSLGAHLKGESGTARLSFQNDAGGDCGQIYGNATQNLCLRGGYLGEGARAQIICGTALVGSNFDFSGAYCETDYLKIELQLKIKERAEAPSTADGYAFIYPKADNKLYYLDGAGAEHELAVAA